MILGKSDHSSKYTVYADLKQIKSFYSSFFKCSSFSLHQRDKLSELVRRTVVTTHVHNQEGKNVYEKKKISEPQKDVLSNIVHFCSIADKMLVAFGSEKMPKSCICFLNNVVALPLTHSLLLLFTSFVVLTCGHS